MNRSVFKVLVVIGLFLFSCVSAGAVTFTGTAVGSWSNVVSTAGDDFYGIQNNDGGEVATFNWGTPATTSFNNRFQFDGVGSDGAADPSWSTDSESAFKIGSFSYRNGSTYNSTGINGVDLDILLQITSPLGLADDYSFGFSIVNTPNNTGNPVLDGDLVAVLNSGISPTTFTYDGTLYTLQLLGFSSDGGTTIRNDFSSPEGSTANADVYARITTDVAPVPEPGTIMLLGAGLIGLGIYGRRRMKTQG